MISLSKLLPGTGCGDNSCRFGSPGGMATNGGCRCIPEERLGGASVAKIQKGMTQLINGIQALRAIAESPEIQAALKMLIQHAQRGLPGVTPTEEVRLRLYGCDAGHQPTEGRCDCSLSRLALNMVEELAHLHAEAQDQDR